MTQSNSRNGNHNDVRLDRVSPHDIDAERACLGSMLEPIGDAETILKVIGILGDNPEEAGFYKMAHERIYAAILRLYDKHELVDLVSLTVELSKSDDLEKVGGVPYIDEMAESVPTSANVEYYARQVQSQNIRRKIIVLGMQMHFDGFDRTKEIEDIMDDASGAISDITGFKGDLGSALISVEGAGDLYANFIDHLEDWAVRFNFPDFDKNIRFAPGDVCVVIAHTSVGKSNFAQTVQMNAWLRQKVKSVYFSLEMSAYHLYERLAAMMLSEHPKNIERMILGNDRTEVLSRIAKEFSGGVYYVDRPGLSLRDMERIIKLTSNVKLVIIDYIQLMRSKGNSQYERMCSITTELKEFAKRIEAAVLVISQVHKGVKNQYSRLVLNDVRDSGTIAEVPDLVLSLRMDEHDDLIRHVEILKSRQMPRATGRQIELCFIGDSPLLGEVSKGDDKDPKFGF